MKYGATLIPILHSNGIVCSEIIFLRGFIFVRDLVHTLSTHVNRETHSMPPVGFEPTISAGKRPQTYALDRAATRTGDKTIITNLI